MISKSKVSFNKIDRKESGLYMNKKKKILIGAGSAIALTGLVSAYAIQEDNGDDIQKVAKVEDNKDKQVTINKSNDFVAKKGNKEKTNVKTELEENKTLPVTKTVESDNAVKKVTKTNDNPPRATVSVAKKSNTVNTLNVATSIVDWMKANNLDSSFENREKLATNYGIIPYIGSAEQNVKLWNHLKDSLKQELTVNNVETTNENEKAVKEENANTKSRTNEKQDKNNQNKTDNNLSESEKENKANKPSDSNDKSNKQENPSTEIPTDIIDDVPKKPSDPVDIPEEKEPFENPIIEQPSQPEESSETDEHISEKDNPVDETPVQAEQPEEKKEEIVTKTTTETEIIPFRTIVEYDDTLEFGKEVVVQEGENGEKEVTYKLTYMNGKLTNKKEESYVVTKMPTDKIIKVGMKDVITTKTVTETETIPFETEYQNDPNLEKGKQVVVQEGKNGVKTITYEETYINGELTNKKQISTKITKEPVKKIVKVGTKETTPQAKSILQNSPLKSSADGTQFYYVDTEYPEVIRVFVDGNNVTKIMWNPMAYNTRNVSKQELVELLGADYAEEVYQYNKKVRSEIESAVRAAANAVYGSGTSKANQLYNQIINTLSQHKTFTF